MKGLISLRFGLLLLLISVSSSRRHKHRKFHEKTIKINSPSLIKKTKTGARMTLAGGSGGKITLNMPPPYYPKVMANPSKQKPIVIVPEIVYPKEKKRVIVHHDVGMVDYYANMMNASGNVNPYYLEMMKENPYWQPYIKDNPAFTELTTGAHLAGHMKKIEKSFKSSKKKGSKSKFYMQLV